MKSSKRLFRTAIISLFATVILSSCGSNHIKDVKKKKLDDGTTIGAAFENNPHLENRNWKSFETEDGNTVVEFTTSCKLFTEVESYQERIDQYNIHTRLKLQFTKNKKDGYDLTYGAGAFGASEELVSMYSEAWRKEYFDFTAYNKADINAIFTAVKDGQTLPYNGYRATKFLDGIYGTVRTWENNKRRRVGMVKLKPHVNRVFDIYGDQLKQFFEHHRRVKVLIRSRDENTHFVSIFGESNYMRGYLHIVSADERSVCEVESMYTQKEVVNEYARKTGYPSGLRSYDVKDNPTMDIVSAKLNATVNKEGEVSCGLNGSLEGEYKFAVEIRFFKKGDYIYPYEARFGDGDSVMCSDDKNWWKQ